MNMEPRVRLEPWSAEDFWLLERKNEPAMTRFLGGPETPEQLADRQRRYEALSAREPAAGRMFRVVAAPSGESVGSVGFWERDWEGEAVYETGWGVLPEFQGRGLAVAAVAELVRHARTHGTRRSLHAFPGTDHPASNAVCHRAGFTCRGEVAFTYRGTTHPSNNWHLPLHP
ncbi:GNAT family N-acetyltransferase [Streptomyces sp. NBC_00249]|uniref:GNAT family N-acetyltransferase n=1 Tax=Streptomyces sp. NBC_00249 TaxID=2975690 RepID=UPI0022510667|nr:GNAT family N-acetyltransferase [Streptomyces sp. NBC_00249]MCX5199106.1 GNAT family N-acetyltransferase [Streptomyces sp. NBC_00249]